MCIEAYRASGNPGPSSWLTENSKPCLHALVSLEEILFYFKDEDKNLFLSVLVLFPQSFSHWSLFVVRCNRSGLFLRPESPVIERMSGRDTVTFHVIKDQ